MKLLCLFTLMLAGGRERWPITGAGQLPDRRSNVPCPLKGKVYIWPVLEETSSNFKRSCGGVATPFL